MSMISLILVLIRAASVDDLWNELVLVWRVSGIVKQYILSKISDT